MGDSVLKRKTIVSLFWSFLDKFGEQLIYLVSGIILLRIVEPTEYGLMGTLMIFTVFSKVIADSGFGRALLNKKDVSERAYSSVFYFNVGISLIFYIALFLIAPFIAKVFNEPRLTAVSRILFLSFVFYSFGIIQQTLLVKRGDFRTITKANIPSLLIAATVAIVMGIKGMGVWCLVTQHLIYSFLRTLFMWIKTGWKPVAQFSLHALRSFFIFSNKLLASGLITAIFNNIYPAIIAYFYPNSMNQVGYYSQANKYQDIPFGMISNAFRSVSMLILSEINQELERLKRVVRKIMQSVAFLAFPIGLYMILAAEPAFQILFGNKWNPAIPYFKGLTIAGMLSPFIFILNELFIARERADFFLGVEIAKRTILVALIVLLFKYGIMGLVASWVLYMFVTLVISLALSHKLIRYTLFDFLKDALPYLSIALVSGLLGYFISKGIAHNLLFLLVCGAVIFGSYWLLCSLLKLEMTQEIKLWFSARKESK